MKFNSEICKKLIGTLLVLCFGLLSFQILFAYSPAKSNLVYCPLQEKWVKGSEGQVFITKDFDNFCAADKRKEFIKTQIHLKTRFARTIQENLIFDYLEKGNQAFSIFNHLPDSPPREVIKKSAVISALNNFSNISINAAAEAFTLEQSARPPTFTAETSFSSQSIRALSEIFRHTNPRSPPSALS